LDQGLKPSSRRPKGKECYKGLTRTVRRRIKAVASMDELQDLKKNRNKVNREGNWEAGGEPGLVLVWVVVVESKMSKREEAVRGFWVVGNRGCSMCSKA